MEPFSVAAVGFHLDEEGLLVVKVDGVEFGPFSMSEAALVQHALRKALEVHGVNPDDVILHELNSSSN